MSVFPLSDATIIALYWLLTVMCCTFAAIAGGATGRAGAAMIATASVASMIGGQFGTWANTHVPVMIIDLILLAGFYWLALKSNSFWPIWATGFHLISVIAHLAVLFNDGVREILYFSFGAFWSLPVLLVMVIGIMRDRTIQLHKG
ncbi:MAG: hypothetical protein ACRCY3_00710 [Sphingorhabdus sp.]